MRRFLGLGALLILVGCAGGDGQQAAVDSTRGEWQVLDLVDGTIAAHAVLDDLAGNPAYRDRLVVFRRIAAPTVVVGQPAGSFARQEDESPAAVRLAPYYIAVFETTRAQWRRLDGTAPWELVVPAGLVGSGDDLPACGVSLELARAAMATWNGQHGGRLALPSDQQWEVAVRAGSPTSLPWGEDRRAAVAARWAVVADGQAADGPQPVGSRLANAWGIHDGVGNVWELTADGGARGGSWADALSLARPANRLAIEPDTRHAAVGLRLVLRP